MDDAPRIDAARLWASLAAPHPWPDPPADGAAAVLAARAGTDPTRAPVRFGGRAGGFALLAGLEALRCLDQRGLATAAPLALVAWAGAAAGLADGVRVVTATLGELAYDVTVTGATGSAAATPPADRQDALVAAARLVDLVDRMMRARGPGGRGTVGRFAVAPGVADAIPGEVALSVVFHHQDDREIARLDAQFPREAGFIARDAGVALAITRARRIAAQAFDPGCLTLAGSDAPTPEDACRRAQALLDAVLGQAGRA